jgi:endo-1,4-beta-xylanase
VTVENHFNAWKSLGLNLGTFNYQVIAIEGWGGSGSASQTVSN